MTKRKPVEERKIAIDFRQLPDGMRQCGKCRDIKHSSEFHKDRRRASGVRSTCKLCVNTQNAELMKDKSSKYYQGRKKYRETNRDVVRTSQRNWKLKNKSKSALYESRRRARLNKLPNTFTLEEMDDLVNTFLHSCAICGSNFEHLDHFIPISTRQGGTVKGNMVPMCSKCNQSKGAKNPFEWATTLKESERERFYYLVKYLKDINGIAMVRDYEAHVNNCFK